MNFPTDTKERLNAAYELLQNPTISYSTFHHIHTLIKGLHPELDKKLEIAAKALLVIEQLQEGDVISLSAQHLPEKSEKDKKRKKALLFFITNIKNLKGEIQRVNNEVSRMNNSSSNNLWHVGRIVTYAKGPLGIITLTAIVIVVVYLALQHHPQSVAKRMPTPTGKQIQVISYNGKEIPLTQLFVGHGPDCDSPHYHAIGEATVTATDGTVFQDPGGCGFGKVKDVQVVTVTQ